MYLCMTEPDLEVNPKWLVLSEVLEEVRNESSESKKLEKCLVVTQDDRTAQQLREVSTVQYIQVIVENIVKNIYTHIYNYQVLLYTQCTVILYI